MRHFYHLYCGRPWKQIALDHIQALRKSGALWQVTVGLVGPGNARYEAWHWLHQHLPDVEIIEAETGWEQVTLRELHKWAKTSAPGHAVLYAHSKGSTHRADTPAPGLLGRVWRESMTRLLVGGWRECVRSLKEYDAIGCHWLTPEAYPGYVDTPFFGGNFWWSKAGYLASLPSVRDEDRHYAEGWIGLGNPKVLDLRPGWPGMAHFAQEIADILNPGAGVKIT